MTVAQTLKWLLRDSRVTTEEVAAEMERHALELDEQGEHGQAELVRGAISKIEIN
jgi:hypothetical protein